MLEALVDAAVLPEWPNEGLKNSSTSGPVAATTLDALPLLLPASW